MNSLFMKEMEIFKKSGETAMFFKFIINDPTLLDNAKILFLFIYGMSARTGYCDISDKDLSRETKLTLSGVKNGLKDLKNRGWLETEMKTISTGSQRRIKVIYHALRKSCPRKKEQGLVSGLYRGFAKDKKGKVNPEAIATYVLCARHGQMFMALLPVAFDERIKRAIPRVLLLIICSLCAQKGYCYAGNKFLYDRLGVTQSTLSAHLTLLESEGLTKMSYGRARHIYLHFENMRQRYLKK